MRTALACTTTIVTLAANAITLAANAIAADPSVRLAEVVAFEVFRYRLEKA